MNYGSLSVDYGKDRKDNQRAYFRDVRCSFRLLAVMDLYTLEWARRRRDWVHLVHEL